MGQYIEKIDKLASLAGYTINPLDRVPLTLLEDEVADLISQNAAKREALKIMAEQIDKAKLELDTLNKEDSPVEATIQEEFKNVQTKKNILENYMDTIINSDAFLINKLKRDIGAHYEAMVAPLKEIHDKEVEMRKELEQLHTLQRECDELRQKLGT